MDKPLNQEIEFTTSARTDMSGEFRSGMLALGNTGIEFVTRAPKGFNWLPWQKIRFVWLETMLGGRFIKGFNIATTNGDQWQFTVAHARTVLAFMGKHLGPQQIAREGRQLNTGQQNLE